MKDVKITFGLSEIREILDYLSILDGALIGDANREVAREICSYFKFSEEQWRTILKNED